MNKIGLALSGGGFRASLYHLGLIRFLRDAGILPQVTHITSVSGGSIIAAHLVLNWDRYNGSPNDFDAAAAEFLSFVQLDVRNRIARRFPLNLLLRLPRWLLGYSNRKLTRTGLLEYHYERYLFGDTSLFELPVKPQLHILATNLSEGCLCSFNRAGLLMVRRQSGHAFRLDRIQAGLATVSMGVAASSAFPGFFPPLVLTGAEVGANAGEFGKQAYTDGGVFDNLGVRMFGCLERQLLADTPLSRDDFVDFPAAIAALRKASTSSEESPLRQLTQILAAASRSPDPQQQAHGRTLGLQLVASPGSARRLSELPPSAEAWKGDQEDVVLSSLWNVMRHYQFQLDPLFASLQPEDPDAVALLHSSRLGGQVLDSNDQLWLNRHLLETAFRQAHGAALLRRLNSGLDGVLVSDVGKRIEVQSNRAGGLIRTALRATDILMDRVWQLEKETFRDAPGFVFAPITDVIDPAEDPTVLHPEIQRQVANVRTDLDRFSTLEISSLVRHGYCVGREACRAHPDLFGADLPGSAPWDPIPEARGAAPSVRVAPRLDGPSREPTAPTVEARTLQASAIRRIWSTLLDYRDWTSYVYVPLLIPLLFLLPYFVVKSYEHSHRTNQLIESFSQGSQDLTVMSRLLENGPDEPWTGVAAEEVANLDEPDFSGFEILQLSTIIDMRNWKPPESGQTDPRSEMQVYRRLKVLKKFDATGSNLFRYPIPGKDPKNQVRFPAQRLQPKFRISRGDTGSVVGEKEYRWEADFDFSKVLVGHSVDLFVDVLATGRFMEGSEYSNTATFEVPVETAEWTMWILMPRGKKYRDFRILRHQPEKSDRVEVTSVVGRYLASDSTIIAFRMLTPEPGYVYEVEWFYK